MEAISPASAKPRLQIRVRSTRPPGFRLARSFTACDCSSGADKRVRRRKSTLKSRLAFAGWRERDWPRLSRLFAGAFHRVQPFASLSDRRRLEAARACLKFTREGRRRADDRNRLSRRLRQERRLSLGAILVTLIPMIDLNDSRSLRWKSPPPPDCIERRLGRPHLTWIFVGPGSAGHGIGSALLAHASTQPARAGLHRADQLVHPGEYLEHALALAQRLRALTLRGLDTEDAGAWDKADSRAETTT